MTSRRVDSAATKKLRETLRAERDEVPFFDRGPGYARLSGGRTSAEVDEREARRMSDRLIVRPDTYYDSVTLMLASRDAEAVEGVTFAAAVTATPVNRSLLEAQGFDLADDNPGPNDLVVALRADSDDAADAAERAISDRLSGSADIATGERAGHPAALFSLRDASQLRRQPRVCLRARAFCDV